MSDCRAVCKGGGGGEARRRSECKWREGKRVRGRVQHVRGRERHKGAGARGEGVQGRGAEQSPSNL